MNRKIAHITDLHLREQLPKDLGVDSQKNWQIILADVKARNINEIIFGGDIGDPSANQTFFETMKDSLLGMTLGNHDRFSEVIKYYRNGIDPEEGEFYFTWQDPFYKYIFLDSSSESVSSRQIHWLQKELLTDRKILLFIHHPILPIDAEADRKFKLSNRDEVKQALIKSGSDITIFCGHYHLEDHTIFGNVEQHITPAGSFQIVKDAEEIVLSTKNFGYRIIELNGGLVNTEVILF